MTRIEVSREEVHWNEALDHGSMGWAGEEVVRTLVERGAEFGQIKGRSHDLAVEHPPLLLIDYTEYMQGVDNALQAALVEGVKQQ